MPTVLWPAASDDSVADGPTKPQLDPVQRLRDSSGRALKWADDSPGAGADNPLLKGVRFEELRFSLDPARERPLCADRRVAAADRDGYWAQVEAILDIHRRAPIEGGANADDAAGPADPVEEEPMVK